MDATPTSAMIKKLNLSWRRLAHRLEDEVVSGEVLRDGDVLGVVVHNLGIRGPCGLCTDLCHPVKGDKVFTGKVVDLPSHGRVANALPHEVGQVLAMPKLRDVFAIVWHAHGAAA